MSPDTTAPPAAAFLWHLRSEHWVRNRGSYPVSDSLRLFLTVRTGKMCNGHVCKSIILLQHVKIKQRITRLLF